MRIICVYVGPIGHCLPTTTTPIPEQATTATTTPAIPTTIVATTRNITTTKKPPITNTTRTATTTTESKLNKQQQQQQQAQTQRSASLNACPQENCLNGGTCLGYSNNYTCICASGYTGLATTTTNRVALQVLCGEILYTLKRYIDI